MTPEETAGNFAVVSGVISLLVALVNALGPAVAKVIVRKHAPDSESIGKIAENNSKVIAATLRDTLSALQTSMGTIQTTAASNAAKIDEVLNHVRPKNPTNGS